MVIFTVLLLGYAFGKLKYKMLTLGTVTSVLLVGVVVGMLFPDVKIGEPLKSVFFLLFLFSIGYSVGPQFFSGFKKEGLPQMLFAVLICLFCFGASWIFARIAGYNAGEAVGFLAGSQTSSAMIGIGQETISGITTLSEDVRNSMNNSIPVVYAVTYLFGTAGSAWILAFLGPAMMGGLKKCREACRKEEEDMGVSVADQPGFSNSMRAVVFRCYKAESDWFNGGKRTVGELEKYVRSHDRRMIVERIEHNGKIIDNPAQSQTIVPGDKLVVSGRREFVIGEEGWIGTELNEPQLLNFPIRVTPTMLTSKKLDGITVGELFNQPWMSGVCIREIRRHQELTLPVRMNVKIHRGDMITLVGMPYDVDEASKQIGRAAQQSTATDIIFLALGILLGGILGVLTIHAGRIPISLTTSGGALIMGLIFGWWHSRRPNIGLIPSSASWVFRDLGLNVFIACVGLSCGPTFIQDFESAGWMLFVWGALATSLPLILGVLAGRYIFKFTPGATLGCVAGSRTTTAALGAIEESLQSSSPAVGYAVTYAVGNTTLLLLGLVMVLIFL